jgi:phosphotransferase system HPr (HPr) family protein
MPDAARDRNAAKPPETLADLEAPAIEVGRERLPSQKLAVDFILTDIAGLHMRPSGAVVELIGRHHCRVDVSVPARGDGAKANGHSIMQVITLAVRCGETVHFKCVGPDTAELLRGLQALEFWRKI